MDEPHQEGGDMQHKLVDILVIVLVGIVCGCEQWIEIEDFAHNKESWLREFLTLPNGISSDDTYRRVMERIKPKQLSAMIRVTRNREQNGTTSTEHAYYISSAPYDAKRFSELIRGHWSIENNLH